MDNQQVNFGSPFLPILSFQEGVDDSEVELLTVDKSESNNQEDRVDNLEGNDKSLSTSEGQCSLYNIKANTRTFSEAKEAIKLDFRRFIRTDNVENYHALHDIRSLYHNVMFKARSHIIEVEAAGASSSESNPTQRLKSAVRKCEQAMDSTGYLIYRGEVTHYSVVMDDIEHADVLASAYVHPEGMLDPALSRGLCRMGYMHLMGIPWIEERYSADSLADSHASSLANNSQANNSHANNPHTNSSRVNSSAGTNDGSGASLTASSAGNLAALSNKSAAVIVAPEQTLSRGSTKAVNTIPEDLEKLISAKIAEAISSDRQDWEMRIADKIAKSMNPVHERLGATAAEITQNTAKVRHTTKKLKEIGPLNTRMNNMERLIRINGEKVVRLQRKDVLNPVEVEFVRNLLQEEIDILARPNAATANTANSVNANDIIDTVGSGSQGGTAAQKRKAEAAEGESATKRRG